MEEIRKIEDQKIRLSHMTKAQIVDEGVERKFWDPRSRDYVIRTNTKTWLVNYLAILIAKESVREW